MHLKDNDMKECLLRTKRLPYVAVLQSDRYRKSALEILNQLLCFYPLSPNKSTRRHVQKLKKTLLDIVLFHKNGFLSSNLPKTSYLTPKFSGKLKYKYWIKPSRINPHNKAKRKKSWIWNILLNLYPSLSTYLKKPFL